MVCILLYVHMNIILVKLTDRPCMAIAIICNV